MPDLEWHAGTHTSCTDAVSAAPPHLTCRRVSAAGFAPGLSAALLVGHELCWTASELLRAAAELGAACARCSCRGGDGHVPRGYGRVIAHGEVLSVDRQHRIRDSDRLAITNFVDSWITWRLHLVAAINAFVVLGPFMLSGRVAPAKAPPSSVDAGSRLHRRSQLFLSERQPHCNLGRANLPRSLPSLSPQLRLHHTAWSRRKRNGVHAVCFPHPFGLPLPTSLGEATANF